MRQGRSTRLARSRKDSCVKSRYRILPLHFGQGGDGRFTAKIGKPVVVLSYGKTEAFDANVKKSIALLGDILNRKERANELLSFISDTETYLSSIGEGIDKSKKQPCISAARATTARTALKVRRQITPSSMFQNQKRSGRERLQRIPEIARP